MPAIRHLFGIHNNPWFTTVRQNLSVRLDVFSTRVRIRGTLLWGEFKDVPFQENGNMELLLRGPIENYFTRVTTKRVIRGKCHYGHYHIHIRKARRIELSNLMGRLN